MKFFKYMLFGGVAMFSGHVFAQTGYYQNAMMFSQTSPTYGSTARMQGIGGAQISLGADLSVAGTNPAGLGFFNKSTISFTPGIDFHNSQSDFLGSSTPTYRTNFNFANLGIALNSNKGNYTNEKFKGGTFAITVSRSNNFNNEIYYEGRNYESSVADSFVEEANVNGADLDDLRDYADLAYSQFLIENADGYLYQSGNDEKTYIYPDGDFDGYTSLVGANSFDKFTPFQSEKVVSSGGQYAINFAWGGNYDDKVYFGGAISMETISLMEERTFTESSYQDSLGNQDDLLNSLTLIDRLETTGSGVSFNGGLIIRPVQFVTIGVNFKSPTFYSLSEENQLRLKTNWNSNYTYYGGLNDDGDSLFYDMGSYDESSALILNDYSLRTPGVISLGTTVFLGKAGFITGDVELVDYSTSQIKSSDFIVTGDNQAISDFYKNTVNLRLGAEFRYENFRFRGGFAHFGDFEARGELDGSRQNYSFGVGYRSKAFFIDLASVIRRNYQSRRPYLLNSGAEPIAEVETKTTSITATLGFNF